MAARLKYYFSRAVELAVVVVLVILFAALAGFLLLLAIIAALEAGDSEVITRAVEFLLLSGLLLGGAVAVAGLAGEFSRLLVIIAMNP